MPHNRTPRHLPPIVLGFIAAMCAPLHAQLINGDFESGAFAPWVNAPTAQGKSLFNEIVPYDLDGPGPLTKSLAARFMVGRSVPGTGYEGIELTQPVSLVAGAKLKLSLDWAVFPLVNAYFKSGGRFQLIVDGSVIAEQNAPSTFPPFTLSYGHFGGAFVVAATKEYDVGVRITRDVIAGEEVFQYVDNIVLAPVACLSDIDGDGRTCQSDLGILLAAFGKCEGDAGYNPAANLSVAAPAGCPAGKQGIDQSDLGVLLADYGCGGCP